MEYQVSGGIRPGVMKMQTRLLTLGRVGFGCPALPVTGNGMLIKLLELFESEFPHLSSGDNSAHLSDLLWDHVVNPQHTVSRA